MTPANAQNHLSITIPAGFSERPATLDDARDIADLWTLVSAHMGQPEQGNEEQQRKDWSKPGFDLASSTLIVEDSNEAIIAYAAMDDVMNPPVRPWLTLVIHPDHENSGVTEYLLHWLETTAQRVLDRCPPDAEIALRMGAVPDYKPRQDMLKARGYTHSRNFLRMVIHM
ncbi:MAG: hypothetical protein KC496_21055, partial [Anaerolineae bacterium]|nr:hypothetical protein [Anaerolineae bacterium]